MATIFVAITVMASVFLLPRYLRASALAPYTTSDRTNEQVNAGGTIAGGDKADAWTAGLKYDATTNIYLATMYSGETRNMTPYGKTDCGLRWRRSKQNAN